MFWPQPHDGCEFTLVFVFIFFFVFVFLHQNMFLPRPHDGCKFTRFKLPTDPLQVNGLPSIMWRKHIRPVFLSNFWHSALLSGREEIVLPPTLFGGFFLEIIKGDMGSYKMLSYIKFYVSPNSTFSSNLIFLSMIASIGFGFYQMVLIFFIKLCC